MIATAQNIPVASLKSLWHTCFSDPYPYIDFFFDHMYRPDHTVVWVEEGHAQSMLFLLDCSLQTNTATYDGAYIYAACTHPDFRSKGYMAALLTGAHTLCEAYGLQFTALVPASEPLFGYYHQFGYETAFYCTQQQITRNQLTAFCEKNTGVKFPSSEKPSVQIRNRFLSGNGLLWQANELSYAFAEHRFTGGRIIQDKDGYLLYHETDEHCRVDELLCDPAALLRLLAQLKQESGAREFFFTLPPRGAAAQKLRGAIEPRGMLRVIGESDLLDACTNTRCYIGLTLG